LLPSTGSDRPGPFVCFYRRGPGAPRTRYGPPSPRRLSPPRLARNWPVPRARKNLFSSRCLPRGVSLRPCRRTYPAGPPMLGRTRRRKTERQIPVPPWGSGGWCRARNTPENRLRREIPPFGSVLHLAPRKSPRARGWSGRTEGQKSPLGKGGPRHPENNRPGPKMFFPRFFYPPTRGPATRNQCPNAPTAPFPVKMPGGNSVSEPGCLLGRTPSSPPRECPARNDAPKAGGLGPGIRKIRPSAEDKSPATSHAPHLLRVSLGPRAP